MYSKCTGAICRQLVNLRRPQVTRVLGIILQELGILLGGVPDCEELVGVNYTALMN